MKKNNKKIKSLKHLLTAPGMGILTVHTASQQTRNLHIQMADIFIPGLADNEKTSENFISYWQENFIASLNSSKPALLAIPSDSGSGILRGSNWGPLFLRKKIIESDAGLSYRDKIMDLGDIRVNPHICRDKYLNKKQIKSLNKKIYGQEKPLLPLSSLDVSDYVFRQIYHWNPKRKLISFGGDHSVSYPAIKNFLKHNDNSKEIAILHFDAHTDLLPRRMGVDITFGSWAYHALKLLAVKSHWIQLGIRSSNESKQYWTEKLGIQQYWAEEIHQFSAKKIAEQIAEFFRKEKIKKVYITFDVDVFDISTVSATGTPESGGLFLKQVLELLNILLKEAELVSFDIVELAPYIHHFDKIDAINQNHEPQLSLETTLSVFQTLLTSMLRSFT